MDTTAPTNEAGSLPVRAVPLAPLQSSEAAVVQCLLSQIAAAPVDDASRDRWRQRLADAVPQIVAMTERLFPGPVDGEFDVDREDASHQWILFNVVSPGSYRDYRARKFQWHDEVELVLPGAVCDFRLNVTPQR